ncbi:MAG: hypothetical protein GYA63_03920 [Armatimonadetes bacterium]|nr:hypothetical protein [Armatimonadota bacterium]
MRRKRNTEQQQPRERLAFGALMALVLLVLIGIGAWKSAPRGDYYSVVVTPPALKVTPKPAPPPVIPATSEPAPSTVVPNAKPPAVRQAPTPKPVPAPAKAPKAGQ